MILKKITKWLRQSGLKFNESRTELCLFHRKNQPLIELTVNNLIKHGKLILMSQVLNLIANFPGTSTFQRQFQRHSKKAQYAKRLF
jgi:hypothetical protein